ncbi:MAG: NHLP bacteriocin export ABC transporter permease/ATPase subunit [Peptococcaceae bacterium]|nr:NHLP bacteriocin export ABC transporter permease/ATPase subunit [Peptococcaceae bacterium]
MSNNYFLKGGAKIITNDKADAWHIASGSVLVYVVPWKNNALGRRAFLYEASAGEVVPSLCFRDYEYTEWRFCLVAVDNAEVSVIKGGSTSALRTRFAQRSKLRDVEREGFDNAVVNYYKMTVVAEDGLIHKTKQEHKTTSENILKLIYNVFNKRQLQIKTTKREGNTLYDTVAVICNRSGIPLAPLGKILEACPSGFTIHDIARISHFTCREVVLDADWHKSDSGALLAFDKNNSPVAFIPKRQNGYKAHFADTGQIKTVSTSEAQEINPKAYALYRPLPNKSLGVKDLFKYCVKSLNKADIFWILLFTAVCTIIGVLLPILNQKIYDDLIPVGAHEAIWWLGGVIGAAMIGSVLFSVAKNIANFRVQSRISVDLQCALQDRLFNLPMSFFREHESADLALRLQGASAVVSMVVTAILGTGVTAVLSIIYFINMLSYSSQLSWAGIIMLVLYAAALLLISRQESKIQGQIKEIDGKVSSSLYQFVNGISKIRMSGAENRALFEYLKPYVKTRELEDRRHIASSFSSVLTVAASTLFSVVLYWLLIQGGGNVTPGMFIAFTSAFGMFSASFMEVVAEISHFRLVKPEYERCKPILAGTPEFDEAKELPGEISGAIELNNVTFSYSPDAPVVLDDVSLSINAGEYVGIVGPSGCGKSTLLRLLLGFETPTTGKIYFDNKDIESLDKRELRKKMGVVLQDGKLISGSIFENITITSPKSTQKDAQRVVREVGLENDIKDMPMGLHTVLSEDCGTISGGQQQRILIARAIIGNPGILFFDEATSALDNVTQAMVCESLDKMNATRLVIAHRLSTIINCDRIIVMKAGKVVEQGRYQELMDARGLFYDLASRQIS